MKRVTLHNVQFLDSNFRKIVNEDHPEFNNIRYEINISNVCPICTIGIDMANYPSINFSDMYSVDNQTFSIFCIHRCPHCYKGFVVEHHMTVMQNTFGIYSDAINCIEYSQAVFPNIAVNLKINDSIHQISPRFYNIYKQCLKAKNSGLSELYGMGFRKALEFLVKDFAVSENPAEHCYIEEHSLHQCIEKYFKDSDAKTALLACKWIGNNETHYINCNDKDDLLLLEALIEDTLYYINRELREKLAIKVNDSKGQK